MVYYEEPQWITERNVARTHLEGWINVFERLIKAHSAFTLTVLLTHDSATHSSPFSLSNVLIDERLLVEWAYEEFNTVCSHYSCVSWLCATVLIHGKVNVVFRYLNITQLRRKSKPRLSSNPMVQNILRMNQANCWPVYKKKVKIWRKPEENNQPSMEKRATAEGMNPHQ